MSEQVPEADAYEQAQPWGPEEAAVPPRPRIRVETPEADAQEQAQVVPLDEEDEWR